MRYVSLFDGLGAAHLACAGLGWGCAAVSEIDPQAHTVAAHHFPHLRNLGDVTQADFSDVGPVDLVCGGSPCQSFSIAGKRLGLDDPRGNLALVMLRVARDLGARWIVFENLPGLLSSDKGRGFGAFLGLLGECGYGWAYRVLDAQYFGVAQRRRRVFVIGYLGDWRRAGAVLFEPESLRGDPPPCRAPGQDIAASLTRGADSSGRGGYAGRRREDDTNLVAVAGALAASAGGSAENDAEQSRLIVAYGGNRSSGPIDVATACNAHGGSHGRLDFESETFVTGNARVRRLTPRECERLQGIPDDFTLVPWRGKPMADGPRYRLIGNSWAVPVVKWIFNRLDAVHRASMSSAAA